jgi:hypothetical protein
LVVEGRSSGGKRRVGGGLQILKVFKLGMRFLMS